jgi:protein ImuB
VVSAAGAVGVSPAAPVAVIWANRVVSCSAAARADGVRRGLRRREAQGRCPELMVLPHDPIRDARAFEPVVAAVEELAPGVEVIRPGVCAVAARGPARYFGGDRAVAARLVEHVTATIRVACQVGIADGRFAAGLAARRGEVVPSGGSRAFLDPFPVDTLELPELTDLLRRLGLRTLGAFAELPARDVLARFGPDGARAHRLARGLDEIPLAARVPSPELAVQVEFDPPVDRVDTAAFAARSLAEELHAGLTRRGLACTRLAIEAQTEHGEQLTRLWRHEGVLTPAAIADRVRWQLDGWLTGRARALPGTVPSGSAGANSGARPSAGPAGGGAGRAGGEPGAVQVGLGGAVERPTAGIMLLRLVPDEVIRHSGLQLGLWGGLGDEGDRASRALARVQGMLGADAVLTAVLGGGRGPDEQVRLVPWGDERTPSRSADQPWPGRVPAPAPATVLPEPVPAEVLAADGNPVGVTGRYAVTAEPARFAAAGRPPTPLVAWAGPWPVDERWWDPAAARRRARFQLLAADGTAWLVALEDGHWWAEAVYD